MPPDGGILPGDARVLKDDGVLCVMFTHGKQKRGKGLPKRS
jgi:hypothetical protein